MTMMKKISAMAMATAMAATMAVGTAMSASAADTSTIDHQTVTSADYVTYTHAEVWYNGAPAPNGASTGCFASVSTNSNTGLTTIVLQDFTFMGITGGIDSCVASDGEDLVNDADTEIQIAASYGNEINVKITFNGLLGTLLDSKLIPGMSNPMDCVLKLS